MKSVSNRNIQDLSSTASVFRAPRGAQARMSPLALAEPRLQQLIIFLLLTIAFGFTASAKESTIQLTFLLTLDQKVYDYTDYGEPPQIAIWLEHSKTHKIKTLFVTHRTASGDWHGKVECPVSLPYWVSRYQKETHSTAAPSHKQPLPDALSGATPQKVLTVKTTLSKGDKWHYFIEVNASGDYNRNFPSMSDQGIPDSQGNGQPSLIYSGEILTIPNQKDTPKLIGRTLQMDKTNKIITDLSGINSAKKLLFKTEVFTIASGSQGLF
jgi:hypothetical protein